MSRSSKETEKIVGALLLGAAIGGVLGVLFAPDKGSETRKKILDQGGDLADAIKDKFSSILREVKNEQENIKENISNMLEQNGSSAHKKTTVS